MTITNFLLFTITLLPLATPTGHLLLELTASTDCAMQVDTQYSSTTLQLRLGQKKTYSFHPRSREESIQIEFSTQGSEKTSHMFYLENTGQQLRRVFEHGNVVVLIQSIYQCDAGFYGQRCRDVEKQSTTGSTTTSSTTTTTTSTTTTTTTTKTTTTTTSTAAINAKKTTENRSDNSSTTILYALVTIIFVLLVLIVIFSILLCQRPSQVYIEPIAENFEPKTPKNKKKLENSDYYEDETSPRYTAAPIPITTPIGSVFTVKHEF